MGRATDVTLRQKVVNTWNVENLSYTALSKRFGLNYHTVRTICLNYNRIGESSLLPNYTACGRKIQAADEKAYRLVRLIKHFHPTWGVGYILTKIKLTFPDLALQGIRNYQKRLKQDRLEVSLPAPDIPKNKSLGKVRKAHDEWQIDAKERIKLASGEETCFLNITDTKTHALLKAKPFSLWTNQPSCYRPNTSIDA